MTNRRILLVEDNRVLADSISLLLEAEGIEATVASDVETARSKVETGEFRLFLLDVALPDGSGFELCEELRMKRPTVPVILLTAKVDESSVVKGLACGASDYVRKPFGNRELVARIRRCLDGQVPAERLAFGGLELDPEGRQVCYRDRQSCSSIRLKPKEATVLFALVRARGEVVSREKLLRMIDPEAEIFDSSLDPHISRIRQAMRRTGVLGVRIASVYGVGFRLEIV